ncbi:unnamed protein product [Ectocarpus sp. 12 AP-2014]
MSRLGDCGGAALKTHPCPAGSSGGGTISRPDNRRGETLGAATSGERASVNPGKASGLRIDSGACPAGGDDDASAAAVSATGTGGGRRDGDNQATTAAAAVATVGRLPPATVRAGGGGARMDIRYLEDLLCSGSKGSRSYAVAAPNPKRKTRPRSAAGGDNGGIETKKRPWKRAGAASGPFSGFSLCVVRLDSVTNNTVGTLTREFRDGGGQVSTHYTPGDTTHIVADASLAASWEKLDDYFSGWDDFEDVVDGAATAGRGRMPDGVPVVSSEWISECLRRSEVVAADAYRLTPPPHRCAAPAAVAPKQQQRSSTATKETNAAAEGCSSSASRAAIGKKRILTSGGEETTDGLVATRNQRADAAGGSASGSGAATGLMNLEGEVGARKPDVDKRRVSQGQPSSYWGPQSQNKEAADMLDGLAELCATRGGDGSVFNERGFKSAAAALRMLGTQITDIEQLKDLRKNDPERVRGIGDGAIKELTAFFAKSKGRARSPVSEADPSAVETCLKLFQEVGWVGAVKAQQLCDRGMRSIEDLRTRGRHLLTEQMRVCLNR